MVITVTCPACAASFPVDPKKIPEGGVRVRCSECANIFRVDRPAPEEAAPEAPVPEEARGDTTAPEASSPDDALGSSTAPSEPGRDGWSDQGSDQGKDEWSAPDDHASSTATESSGADTGAESKADEPGGATERTADSELASDEAMPDWAAETEEEAPRTDAGGRDEWASGAGVGVEDSGGWAGQESSEPETDPETDHVPEPTTWVDAEPEPGSWSEPDSSEEPTDTDQALPDAIPVQEPATAAESGTPVQGFTFGKRDPMDKARRLARVLVSDMVMYNSERHQQALAKGTLAEDFDEEIEKSWKEFVDQVGPEIAEGEGRRFWSQALNDILAKGASVF